MRLTVDRMVFAYPTLGPEDHAVLGMIAAIRRELRHQLDSNPVRWTRLLRRNTLARAIQGSNGIEGYDAGLADAVAIVDHDKPLRLQEDTERALIGYRRAMTYILSLHDDPHAVIDTTLIRSLHFMMTEHDTATLPGRWRTGDGQVVREPGGEPVYEAPQWRSVPGLMAELAAQIGRHGDDDAIVLAALVHLNLTMIHPFRDANGRMARALQTTVLTRDPVLSPEFNSIEEWLGLNTARHDAVLAEVGQGAWNPGNDVLPWIRFCLTGHYQQAVRLRKRGAAIGRAWTEIENIRRANKLPERTESAMMDAAAGTSVTSTHHRREHGISETAASRDFKAMVELGLLAPVGDRRWRRYVATDVINAITERLADPTPEPDPYKLV